MLLFSTILFVLTIIKWKILYCEYSLDTKIKKLQNGIFDKGFSCFAMFKTLLLVSIRQCYWTRLFFNTTCRVKYQVSMLKIGLAYKCNCSPTYFSLFCFPESLQTRRPPVVVLRHVQLRFKIAVKRPAIDSNYSLLEIWIWN